MSAATAATARNSRSGRLAPLARSPFLTGLVAILGLITVALGVATMRNGWRDLWLSPDQRGRSLFDHGRYQDAASAFRNPLWRGVALMRAGDFKTAAQVFGGVDTPVAAYNQGNALVMLGQYEAAIGRYDRALALQPGWADAAANREIARLRLTAVAPKGGDMGDQRLGADQIVYDKDSRNKAGQDTDTAGAPMSDEAVRSLWLKRVQTQPADFLRSRFAYQREAEAGAGARP